MEYRECRKCLLFESQEFDVLKTVENYLQTVDDELKVNDEIYKKRLSFCKECDFLISGMCRKCGCYVEIRAALKENDCPNYDNKKW